MRRRALILGGADSVWRDEKAARKLAKFHATIAVNDAGAAYSGPVDILATLHPEKLGRWIAERRERRFPSFGRIAAHAGNGTTGRRGEPPADISTDYRWPGMSVSGSSGLFAVKVAIEQGFDRIVLCGVPMEPAGAHFFDPRAWKECEIFKEAWITALPHIAEKTRSMGGWTQELLGPATRDWLSQ
ncbi:conserved hypothetical protein [Hyphomicrobiales bacterium]|nr:conserved hypothetical protein [Hyphomicrobiales bacterium]CAH1664087.1 conserved hypothetical protein [Hyphomicrobiales bacterium]